MSVLLNRPLFLWFYILQKYKKNTAKEVWKKYDKNKDNKEDVKPVNAPCWSPYPTSRCCGCPFYPSNFSTSISVRLTFIMVLVVLSFQRFHFHVGQFNFYPSNVILSFQHHFHLDQLNFSSLCKDADTSNLCLVINHDQIWNS